MTDPTGRGRISEPPDHGPWLRVTSSVRWILSLLGKIRAGWKEFWSWRRIKFSKGGILFTAGAFAVGFAAINTGNNLLYLLLGAMLGFIAVSSWLSEQVIGKISVQRRVPRGVTVDKPLRILYRVENNSRRIPSFAVEIGEEGLPGQAFVPFLKAGDSSDSRSENRFIRRGVFPLEKVTVSTSFPFGLFRKTRSLKLQGEVVVWPRTDRKVRTARPRGGRNPSSGSLTLGSAGPRGEYKGLREYRPGDDPRDIHWRTTARLGEPVVREYEQNDAETIWICLDTRGEDGDEAEAAVEICASLTARAFQEGKRFGLTYPGVVVDPGQGPGQLERILDALARVDFSTSNSRPIPPVARRLCVLVSLHGTSGSAFGDVIVSGKGDPGARRNVLGIEVQKKKEISAVLGGSL